MSRVCQITGKRVLVGHNVSHSNIKTKRRYLPNLQERRILSDVLGEFITLRLSTNALRTLEKRGGIDGYLLTEADSRLDGDMRRLKRRIREAKDAQTAA